MDTCRVRVWLLLALLRLDISAASQFPTQLMIKEWVDQMQKELTSLADKATAGRSLTQIFLRNQHLYTIEQNDADKLVDRAAWNIEQLLRKRSAALEKLASAAEKFQMEHQWRDEFEDKDIFYYNSKDNLDPNKTEERIRPDFKHDASFKRLTDYNYTAVHIPTDIYNGSTIVLNELNWTKHLEDVFRKNREDDPTLLWQVFGSATGLARYYPASPWMDVRKTPSKIDLYDVRRRPWYIQGAASPKDMLILVDASGSVSGLTLKLIRTSVGEMLETLSDDDYVNVVYFNTRVKKTACFDHLVQANVRNKKLLKDAVQNMTAKGITNYTKGFEFAFQQLSTSSPLLLHTTVPWCAVETLEGPRVITAEQTHQGWKLSSTGKAYGKGKHPTMRCTQWLMALSEDHSNIPEQNPVTITVADIQERVSSMKNRRAYDPDPEGSFKGHSPVLLSANDLSLHNVEAPAKWRLRYVGTWINK
ncbi:voltage-dependent calcium channel subunit alpha-2/delta-1-like [Eucyclogobius newberryi]|uniref:voltage-dependent calcium channel subunit alpha-2/delta-1-like n=1 Tax=Eucyclogobius newberryi TaxID=166745 RepID=UPI003B5B633B